MNEKNETIRQHRELWEWVARETIRQRCQIWHTDRIKHFFQKYNIKLRAGEVCCHYVDTKVGFDRSKYPCSMCPVWGNEYDARTNCMPCLRKKTEYGVACHHGDFEKAAAIAHEIAEYNGGKL